MQKIKILVPGILASLLAFGVTGCGQQDQQGPMEKAGQKMDQAADKTGNKLNQAKKKMSQAADKAGNKMGQAAETAGEKMKDATQ